MVAAVAIVVVVGETKRGTVVVAALPRSLVVMGVADGRGELLIVPN